MLDHLAEPAEPWISNSGLSWEPRPDYDPAPDDASPAPPRALNRRLTAEQQDAIIMEYINGVRQKALAVHYGISERSVKRLIANARRSGVQLRGRAS
jgi:DNA-directed RNA polymerase specialized sigma24 family protein